MAEHRMIAGYIVDGDPKPNATRTKRTASGSGRKSVNMAQRMAVKEAERIEQREKARRDRRRCIMADPDVVAQLRKISKDVCLSDECWMWERAMNVRGVPVVGKTKTSVRQLLMRHYTGFAVRATWLASMICGNGRCVRPMHYMVPASGPLRAYDMLDFDAVMLAALKACEGGVEDATKALAS